MAIIYSAANNQMGKYHTPQTSWRVGGGGGGWGGEGKQGKITGWGTCTELLDERRTKKKRKCFNFVVL